MEQIQNPIQQDNILTDIRRLIDTCRQQVALAVNSGLTMMYWHIGERINREFIEGTRAAYGKRIVANLSTQLTEEYGGREFSEKNLNRMRQFATVFPDISIWTPVVSKLSWSHFLQVLSIEDDLKRQFYLTMDLEEAIVSELQKFITEMGNDFAFMARQKRISVDDEDYYIDLLFFNRRLRAMVAVDLKLGKFQAAYKGQMELYLRWLEKYEMLEGENKPIGLILCAGKNEEHVELMHLHESNIRVADYLTKLPDRRILEQKLQQAVERAQNRIKQARLLQDKEGED